MTDGLSKWLIEAGVPSILTQEGCVNMARLAAKLEELRGAAPEEMREFIEGYAESLRVVAYVGMDYQREVAERYVTAMEKAWAPQVQENVETPAVPQKPEAQPKPVEQMKEAKK